MTAGLPARSDACGVEFGQGAVHGVLALLCCRADWVLRCCWSRWIAEVRCICLRETPEEVLEGFSAREDLSTDADVLKPNAHA